MIFSVTKAFPGSYNDKTIVRYDDMIRALRTDAMYRDFEYVLHDGDGAEHVHRGLYAINDGGYHRWKTTISGFPHSVDPFEQRFTERLESVRKDVECVFGIMKKRWRVLRLPFLSTDAKQIEEVFKCCAALHNMLLKFDGRDNIGELDDDWLRADIEADDAQIGQATIRCGAEA